MDVLHVVYADHIAGFLVILGTPAIFCCLEWLHFFSFHDGILHYLSAHYELNSCSIFQHDDKTSGLCLSTSEEKPNIIENCSEGLFVAAASIHLRLVI